MSKTAGPLGRRRTVRENIDRWRDRVVWRMPARHPRRPPWDRERFLADMEADHPFYPRAGEIADAFEAAIAQANGNPERFKLALEAELNSRQLP